MTPHPPSLRLSHSDNTLLHQRATETREHSTVPSAQESPAFFVLKQPDFLLSVLTGGKEDLAVIFSTTVWAGNTLSLPALLHIHFKSS